MQFLHADSEDTDQIARMRRLNCVITKTRLYNFDPLKPHFYIVKLEFTGVYIIFLIFLKNIDCGTSALVYVPTIYVLSRNMKKNPIVIRKKSIFSCKFSIYTERKKKRRVNFIPKFLQV